jgi:hypothetical protein
MDLKQYRYASETSRMIAVTDSLDKNGIKYDLQIHIHQIIDRQNEEVIDYEVILPTKLDADFAIKIKINESNQTQSISKFMELATTIGSDCVIGKDPVEDWTQDTYSDRFKFSEIYKSQLTQQPRTVEMEGNVISIPLNITTSSFVIFKSILAFDAGHLNEYGTTEFYKLYRNSVFNDQTLQLNVFGTIDHLCNVFPEVNGFVRYKLLINGFEVSCEWMDYSVEECNFEIQIKGDKTRIANLTSQNQFVFHRYHNYLAIHSFKLQKRMNIIEYFIDTIQDLTDWV